MAIILSDNLNVATNAPVDVKYGPYSGVDEAAAILAANTALSSGVRFEGLTVGLIIGGGDIVEYWYRSGIANADLVEKTSGSGGSNGELLNTSIFQADAIINQNQDPPAFAIPRITGPASTFGQVAFDKNNPGVPSGATNRNAYASIARPANTDDFIRVVATLFIDFHHLPNTTSQEYNMYFGLHNNLGPIVPADMEYGWVQETFTNVAESSSLPYLSQFMHIHQIWWDIQVSDLIRANGSSPVAGQQVPIFLKAAYESTSSIEPIIRFGNWYKTAFSTGSYTNRFAAGPSRMDVYLLDNSKYEINPQLA
tara:strand:+ start:11 stop:940 length:930 start_codon:yes stop_codon:yes gene_type:complete